MRRLLSTFVCFAVAGSATAAAAAETADLVLKNGKIVTVDPARPQAQALAAKAGRIVAVGSDAEIAPYVGQGTRVIDLAGRLAVPGLIEGHGHFTGIGQAKLGLELMSARSWDDIVAMVAEAARKARPGEWIQGRGWHQEKWDHPPSPSVEGFPTHASLDRVSPDNPVLLTHASGHASFANARALQLAKVDRNTANPPGGEILKDAAGQPVGLLRETAQGLVRGALAEARARRSRAEVDAEARRVIELAAQECVSKGLTSFQDAGSQFDTIELMKTMAREGRLPLRLWVMVREPNEALAPRLAQLKTLGFADDHVTVRAIKKQIDGALGPHGAWLLEPYTDLPTSTGLNTTPVAEIAETARLALANGFQLCVHAIGDRANRETLNIFEKAAAGRADLRWRVEHAQHLHPDDIPRFARLGVIASMQAIHCTSDGPWVIKRLGERRAREGAYVWRSLMKTGAVVTNGTDAPVEDVSPIASFYAAVSRRMKDGREFFPEQKMTREEALAAYTLSNAYAGFEEKDKGSLAPGKLADVTVLSRDIMTVPESEIAGAQAVYTIVGGKVVFERK
jgi:predicted amidohydrolase YtcJ